MATFDTDGNLNLPTNGIIKNWNGNQYGIIISDVPTSSKGQGGDLKNSIAFDDSYLYYCTGDYLNTMLSVLPAVSVNSSGRYVAIMTTTGGDFPAFTTSTDGITWTQLSTIYPNSQGTMTSITVNSSGRFVAVGYNSQNKPLYTTSTNGTCATIPLKSSGS